MLTGSTGVKDLDVVLFFAAISGERFAEFPGWSSASTSANLASAAEPLAGKLRKGSAASNKVADHLEILDAAIAALPPGFRRRLMVTCDGADASHGLIERLDTLAARAAPPADLFRRPGARGTRAHRDRARPRTGLAARLRSPWRGPGAAHRCGLR